MSKTQRLQRLYDFAEKHPEYAVIGSIADVTDDSGVWGEYPLEEKPRKKTFYWNSPFAHPTVIMRKDVLDKMGGYREAKETWRHEDYDLFMRMYAGGYKGYNIQEKLYEYRIVNGNKKYRPMKDRINEAVVRYKGFRRMGILGVKGVIYVIKPVIIGIIPQKLFRFIKKKQYSFVSSKS